jgi:ribonuclease P protein subunit RPR2
MPRRNTAKDKKIQREIANRRINQLFSYADEYALSDNLNLADRYVRLARKISMRCLVSIPNKYKRSFCKHCYGYLLPGVTSRTRIGRSKLIIYCINCKKYTRIPLNNVRKNTSATLK